jgi:hypothetical protein
MDEELQDWHDFPCQATNTVMNGVFTELLRVNESGERNDFL